MNFKDLLEIDADNIMSLDEFSELATLDGLIIKVQFGKQTDELQGKETKNTTGLYGDLATLHFKTTDYTTKRKRIPRQGESVLLNGKRFEVISSAEFQGISRLTLKAFRQNRLRKFDNDFY